MSSTSGSRKHLNKKRNGKVSKLPVQLTWKGQPIYFPNVVISEDLRKAVDDKYVTIEPERINRSSPYVLISAECKAAVDRLLATKNRKLAQEVQDNYADPNKIEKAPLPSSFEIEQNILQSPIRVKIEEDLSQTLTPVKVELNLTASSSSNVEKKISTPRSCKPTPKSSGPNRTVYRCKLCPNTLKLFNDQKKYRNHLAYHKFKEKSIAAVKKSGLLHQSTKLQEFHCSSCEKDGKPAVFTSLALYQQHCNEHEHFKKTFLCGDCGKWFKSNVQLQKHQNVKCKKIQCQYACHCGDKFHTINALQRHDDKIHQKGSIAKVFRCYVCDEVFPQSLQLDDHVKDKHPVDYHEFQAQKKGGGGGTTDSTDNISLNDMDDQEEPIYPEVIMSVEDETQKPDALDLGASLTLTSTREETSPSSKTPEVSTEFTWNFIPGLTGDDMESNDSSDEEGGANISVQQTFVMEPEDVAPLPVPHSAMNNRKQLIVESGARNHFEKKRKQTQQESNLHSNNKKSKNDGKPRSQRQFHNDGSYQCGYCCKQSHRVCYLKSHHYVHPGLPFKCVDLSDGKIIDANTAINYKRVRQKKQMIVAVTPQVSAPATSTTAVPKVAPTTMGPLIATVSPQVQSVNQNIPVAAVTGRRSSLNSESTKPKTPPQCTCAVEDSVLGFHKRCTGELCACYSIIKGCSENCLCKGSCGNPYFRIRRSVANTGSAYQEDFQKDLLSSVDKLIDNALAPVPDINKAYTENFPMPSTTNLNATTSFDQNQSTTASQSIGVLQQASQYVNRRTLHTPPPPHSSMPLSSAPASASIQIYRCFCQKDFETLTPFLTHQYEHKNEKLFLCPVCQNQYSTVDGLIFHANIHINKALPQIVPKINCNICGTELTTKEEFDLHVSTFHANWICDVCEEFFPSEKELKTHRVRHGKCTICGVTFFNQIALRSHITKIHRIDNGTRDSIHASVTEVIDIADEDSEDGGKSGSPTFPVIVSVTGTANFNY